MYFDNASTSFPKPQAVIEGINNYLAYEQGNSQRTTGKKNTDMIYETRKKLANFFGVKSINSMIFTSNATESINVIIYGLLEQGDHVVTTATEHNSVLRPLLDLKEKGIITISWVDCDSYGAINASSVIKKVKENTKLVIVNHGSNVTGAIQDIEKIGSQLKSTDAHFLIDTSQTAGHIHIDNKNILADFIVFTGHKGLLGCTGIGGFYINPEVQINPLKIGGTGVLSELLSQPQGLPLKYESGTLNSLGIHSLYHSLDYLNSISIDTIGKKLEKNTDWIVKRISGYEDIEVYSRKNKLGIVSFNISKVQPVRVSHFLEEGIKLKSRAGLLCAPLIHEHLNTNPFGCVRVSISHFTTDEEIEKFLRFIDEIIHNLSNIRNIKVPQVYETPTIYNV
ncbi:cysteine desulfurase [Alkalihalobacillus alcalophilus ATCC 27647 = CGMCC 1.3604]|uniref:cysteine desulfurase n=1 Tax=Alkalihalobacillus alcalophilus ATCC 27647 = CGMCC 1.3604 TaxID=1218173 RepID=A0A4S4JUH4_ALKAL|nr:aminotransferase class V-fold PLP-dependent enzyme [Alkalihalobacillus alcalophilus]MED1562294.1 aminotransferase class V-fold PLP-dependent enzyme [Alkalihalobacillus alcalophilus]THG88805.1 cysteine desulfurase [Alkalihalobacillus alcalophilus ATCC 27647 = CGMCC 1.3604]